MKKFLSFAAVAILLISCFAIGRASTGLSEDGKWWAGLDEAAKISVVQGGVDSYAVGYTNGVFAEDERMITEATEKSKSLGVTIRAIARRKLSSSKSARLSNLPKFSRSFGFYVAGVSDFYTSRSSSASKVTIGDVLGCLSDNPFVTCNETEEMFKQ